MEDDKSKIAQDMQYYFRFFSELGSNLAIKTQVLASGQNDANLNYIGLDSKIECFVIGRGFTIVTMNKIKLHADNRANFFDVNDNVSAAQV
ncbi:unnamed protein product [Rotaria sp. Silwood1]|nr:unnamed protein product [Rotaria sp. Silwood1]CAF4822607.1 unnamed protein product [Rotaria sp. Silwood1]